MCLFPFSLSVTMGEPQAAGYGWGFKKNTEHKIPDVGKYKEMLDKYGAFYADHSGDKHIYLTFDSGYEEGLTDDILDILKEEDVPATFFVAGHYVDSEPELINRMVEEGHIIGNHSYHHPELTILTKEGMKNELETLEKAVAEVSDQKELKFLRPPKGVFNEQTLQWSYELGYIHIFWSLTHIDWNKTSEGWQHPYEQVMKNIHPGAIILFHTISEDNVEALKHIIPDLREQGYEFKSLDDLVLKHTLPEPILGYE